MTEGRGGDELQASRRYGNGNVTPLGIGVEKNWGAVLAGESGVGAITRFDASRLPSRIAGEVKVSGRRTSSSRMIWTE